MGLCDLCELCGEMFGLITHSIFDIHPRVFTANPALGRDKNASFIIIRPDSTTCSLPAASCKLRGAGCLLLHTR